MVQTMNDFVTQCSERLHIDVEEFAQLFIFWRVANLGVDKSLENIDARFGTNMVRDRVCARLGRLWRLETVLARC